MPDIFHYGVARKLIAGGRQLEVPLKRLGIVGGIGPESTIVYVGEDGISLEEFLTRPVQHWLKA
jgi:hypothetical protein